MNIHSAIYYTICKTELFCIFERLRYSSKRLNHLAGTKPCRSKLDTILNYSSFNSVPPIFCSRRQFQILLLFSKKTNKTWYFTRILCCWQTILMKYHTLFFSKLGKMSQNLSSAAAISSTLPTGAVQLLITIATSWDPAQNQWIQNCLTLWKCSCKNFLKKLILTKVSRQQKRLKYYPVCKEFKCLFTCMNFDHSV